MSLKTEVDELRSNVVSLNSVRQDYITKLNSKGASLASNASFVDIINGIYNLYCSTVKTFVHINFSDFPTGTGISDVETNFRRIEIIRDAIFNALRTRNVELDDDITIIDMIPKIDDIVENPVSRMEPISVTTTEVSTSSTKVTINEYTGGTYKYSLNEVYGDNISYWETIDSKDTIVYCNATDSITIVKDNTIFFGTVNIVKPVDPTTITVTFSYGTMINYTKISITSSIPYTNVYYSLQPYTIHQADIFYGDDPSGVRFNKWNGTDEIRIDGGGDPKLYVVLTNDDNIVVGAGYGITKCGIKANRLYIKSAPGNEYGETILTVASVLTPGNMYRYYRGSKSPMYDEDISSLETFGWNGESPLFLNQAEMITVFEVTSNYKVRKYDNVIVSVKLHELGTVVVTTEADEEEGKCIINITTPKQDPSNSWYYKITTNASLPTYGTDIDSSYTKAPSSIFTVEASNKMKIVVVDYNDTEKIVAAGNASIVSNMPYAKLLLLKSEVGSTLGFTKVTVVSPELTEGNRYVYTKGNAPITYGTPLLSGWALWNGLDEIPGFTAEDEITVAEVTSNTRELRKIGVINANPRPLELLPLSVSSRTGSYGGFTIILVSPNLTTGNEYRYAFNVHEPKLYDNASRWRLWDGSSEIEVEEEYGLNPTVVVAECNSDHLVLKTGSTIATVNEGDPKLKKLTITLSDGSTPETAYVHLDATVIGTNWKYKYIYMEDIIAISDPANYHWDCSAWTEYTNGEIPYRASRRLYIAICTDNDMAEYMGTIVANK